LYGSNDKCRYKTVDASIIGTAGDLKPATINAVTNGAWAIADSGVTGKCFNMSTDIDGTSASTNDIANFVKLQHTASAAYATTKIDQTKYTDMKAAAVTQAGLEKTWLKAFYHQQFWAAMQAKLTDTTASTRSLDFRTWYGKVDVT